VSLIAFSRQGTDTTTQVLVLQQAPAAPLAAFTVAGGDCAAPCQVTFTNNSQHATGYAWNFGDGTTSTEASPGHTYQAGGTFTAALTATGPGGSHTVQQSVTIAHTAPVADFSFTGGDCPAPCQVSFTNASRHATAYSWDFGDGTTASEANPVHQFSGAGTYQVSLRVTGTGGSHSVTKPVSITQNATPVSVTPAELLCSQPWILTGLTVNSQDEYATMLECDKDNQITFDRNGSYVLDEGPRSCMPSSSQTTPGTWSLGEVNGQPSLTLTEGDVSQTTTIVELTPTTLVLRHDDNTSSFPTTIIVSYSHPRQ
jgi:PKD repeat protein